jgi:MoxR-like ATPase
MAERAGAEEPVDALVAELAARQYVVDRPLATVLHLAERLELPVLLEGEPGVGKTAVAEALAAARGARLVRLQCYEGLSAHHALYEWDYARQLLDIRIGEAEGISRSTLRSRIFSPEFLLRRPLLEAIWPGEDRPVLLLVDEVDRADEEFEALLLEVLSQFQVTIPEIGTIRAERRPTIILTANRTRALSDALRRRCLYHWIGFPSLEREIRIVRTRLPEASHRLVQRGCLFVQRLRSGYYRKAPGISETVDWLRALTLFGATDLEPARVEHTLGCLLKDADDIAAFLERDREQVYRESGLLPGGRTA